MKKKFVGVLLCLSMIATILGGCSSKSNEKTSGNNTKTNQDSNKENNTKDNNNNKDDETNNGDESQTSSDEGKVLNIYCWNEEFKSRITDHYSGYEAIDATSGTIGDVTVKWNITPNADNAYQNNLDATLLKQADAAADDKIDIFLVEADYALKYVESEYAMPITDLGITEENLADQYKYTKDIVTDSNGVLKGVTWQACPGALFYNREAAKEVFGTDDPAKVQEYVKDWDTFSETAKTLKDAGYNIMSSANDTYRVYSNNVSSKWVVDGKINIDDNIMKWAEDSKELIDAGYTTSYEMFSDDWKKGFYPEGKVFCYFGPAWLVNFSMAADTEGSIGNLGGWGATEGPQGFFWGGTWICAATGTDNQSLVKDIMLQLTANEEVMIDIVKKDDDFVNNKKAMEAMASGEIKVEDENGNEVEYSSKILGGQNPLGIYCKGVDKLDLSNLSSYDLGCTEEFQHMIKNYFEGNATMEESLDLFYKAVVEKYPELTY